MCKGPRTVTSVPFNWFFSLCSLLWNQVGWFCRFSCGLFNPNCCYIPSFHSFAEFPNFCLMCDIGSLYLVPSVARWSLSNNSYVRLLSLSVEECHYQPQWWFPSHGTCVELDQSLFGNSHNFYFIFTSAFLIGETTCNSVNSLWLGCCHSHGFRSLASCLGTVW